MKSTAAAGNFCTSITGCLATARPTAKAETAKMIPNNKVLSTSFSVDVLAGPGFSGTASHWPHGRLVRQLHECSASSGIATSAKKGPLRAERKAAQAVAISINNWPGRGRLFDKASAEKVARIRKANA